MNVQRAVREKRKRPLKNGPLTKDPEPPRCWVMGSLASRRGASSSTSVKTDEGLAEQPLVSTLFKAPRFSSGERSSLAPGTPSGEKQRVHLSESHPFEDISLMINPSSREDWSLLGESVSLASDSSPATSSSARRCSASAIARTPLPSPLGQTESLCRQISYASSLIGSDLPISACTNVSLPAPGSLSLSDLATPSRLTEGSRLMSPTERSDAFDKERETWIMAPQAAWEALHKRLADLEAQVTALQSAVYDSTQHDDRDLRSFGDGASSQRDSRPDDKVDHQPVVHESLNLDSPGRRPVSSPLTVQRL